ncbi:MAG: hypothetical protein QM820_02670 [Minicystis sp.]
MPRASLPALAACLALISGCGARGALDAGGDVSTSAPTPPPCAAWQPAGPIATVSEPVADGATSYLMSVIPSADGALLAWLTLGDAPMSSWRTVALDFDAAPRVPITTHLSFPTENGGSPIDLATSGSAFAALVSDSTIGRLLLPLDENGSEIGPPVTIAFFALSCTHLAPTPDGFSFIGSDTHAMAPFRLVDLDAKGSVLSVTPLPTPSGSLEDGWRTLHDRSFLLATTDEHGVATSAQHVSPSGAPLSAATEIAAGGPFEMPITETSAGVLAAWSDSLTDVGSIHVRLLDEHGSPLAAAARVVEGDGGVIALADALAATPTGDALLVYRVLDDTTRLHALALGPDGAPRGAPTLLGSFALLGATRAVVSPDGRRALLVAAGAEQGAPERVLALPLACVP